MLWPWILPQMLITKGSHQPDSSTIRAQEPLEVAERGCWVLVIHWPLHFQSSAWTSGTAAADTSAPTHSALAAGHRAETPAGEAAQHGTAITHLIIRHKHPLKCWASKLGKTWISTRGEGSAKLQRIYRVILNLQSDTEFTVIEWYWIYTVNSEWHWIYSYRVTPNLQLQSDSWTVSRRWWQHESRARKHQLLSKHCVLESGGVFSHLFG